mmetsp:Transcript_30535/g.77770  ORF Transcript_30535/g.77770 Transcript_30535/m.77770 type:complete len:434 (+) Transcript_30535:1199-2500(+)
MLLLLGPRDDLEACGALAEHHEARVAEDGRAELEVVQLQDCHRGGAEGGRPALCRCHGVRRVHAGAVRRVARRCLEVVRGVLHELGGVRRAVHAVPLELDHGADAVSDAHAERAGEVGVLARPASLADAVRAAVEPGAKFKLGPARILSLHRVDGDAARSIVGAAGAGEADLPRDLGARLTTAASGFLAACGVHHAVGGAQRAVGTHYLHLVKGGRLWQHRDASLRLPFNLASGSPDRELPRGGGLIGKLIGQDDGDTPPQRPESWLSLELHSISRIPSAEFRALADDQQGVAQVGQGALHLPGDDAAWVRQRSLRGGRGVAAEARDDPAVAIGDHVQLPVLTWLPVHLAVAAHPHELVLHQAVRHQVHDGEERGVGASGHVQTHPAPWPPGAEFLAGANQSHLLLRANVGLNCESHRYHSPLGENAAAAAIA